MNIFYLDRDPTLAAQYHVDRHVVKMIVEYAQLLSAAHRVHQTKLASEDIYRLSHKNHPSAVWAREAAPNYAWLWSLLEACCKEYTHRYRKVHKVERDGLLSRLRTNALPMRGKYAEATPLRLAMPDELKSEDPVESYRDYYAKSKQHLLVWTGRSMPLFLVERGFREVLDKP